MNIINVRIYRFKFLCLISYIIGALSLQAQYELKTDDDLNWYKNIAQEKIYVHHNSNVLLVGETLYYKLYCLNARTERLTKNSKIAYVELIGESGTVFKHKLKLNNGTSFSGFFIPTTVATGMYKLVAYTHWMRNNGDNSFYETDIAIINPYSKINFESNLILADTNDIAFKEFKQISITTNQDSYTTREQVQLKINSYNPATAYGNFSISVYKKDELSHLIETSPVVSNYMENYKDDGVSEMKKTGEVISLPEYDGELVTGRVTDLASGAPAGGVEVVLSILSNEAYQNIKITNDNGVFYFQLKNRFMDSKAMLQVIGEDRHKYKIEVDEHVSIAHQGMTFKTLKIGEDLKDYILKRSINNQIQNAYQTVKQDELLPVEYLEQFYGNHKTTYILDDYKRFATIAETLTEVVDHAYHERKNGKKRFVNIREREKDPYYGVDILPMIVVDGVLIQDHESILYYDASKVEAISVLRDEYYYGKRVFQGVLLIETFDKNYYENMNESYLEQIEMFSPQRDVSYFTPNYSDENDSKRIPDFRNQLFWRPNFELESAKNEIIFYTSDEKGIYEIIMQGFAKNGRPITIKKSFEID